MKHNKLYRLINDMISGRINQGPDLDFPNFSSKTDVSHNNYFLHALKLNKNHTFVVRNEQRYQLKSHHISIYEFQDDTNPTLSQYHYTAYFSNQFGKHFELHVYFNHNDKLTMKPIFSSQDDGIIHWNKENSDLSQNLIDFAIMEIIDVVRVLRRQQREYTATLEALYVQFESDLSVLSMDLIQNKYKYVSILKDTLKILDLLSYYNENQHYHSLIKAYQLTNKNMDLLLCEDLVPVIEDPEISDDRTFDASLKDNCLKVTNKIVKESLSSLVALACESQAAFLAVQKSGTKTSNKDKLNFFLRFRQHTYDALLFAEDTNYITTVSDLQKIQKLISECTKQGKGLLELLLLFKEYTLAQNLAAYVNLVQDGLFIMALNVDNSELLEILLKNGNIPINTFTVKEQLTPLLFCFDKSKHRCFSMLQKYGASLMIQAPDDLPIAHHILSNINHPLRNALLDNFNDKTVKKLYQSLGNYIEKYLETQELGVDQKLKLESSLKNYRQETLLLKELKTPTHHYQYQKLQAQSNELVCKLTHGRDQNTVAINKIREDSDVQNRFSTYSELIKEYMSKLSRKQKRQELKGFVFHQNIDQLLDKVDLNTVDLKASVLQSMDNCIKVMRLKIELVEIQKKPLVVYQNIRSSEKKALSNTRRQTEIIQEINDLQNQGNLQNKHAADLSDALSRMSALLQKLSVKVNSLKDNIDTKETEHNSGGHILDWDDEFGDLNLNEVDFLNTARPPVAIASPPQPSSSIILSSYGLFGDGNTTPDPKTAVAAIDAIETETQSSQISNN